MFAIVFQSEETEENFWENVYETKEEAVYNMPEYPGYGSRAIIEVSEEDALEFLINSIGEEVYVQMSEDGADYESDYDGSIEESYWFKEVKYRIDNKLPGWQLLERHYC